MSRAGIVAALLTVVLTAGGCSFAPEYERPVMDLPQAWTDAGEHNLDVQWWRRFNDDTLNALVEEALAHNLDLEQALARWTRPAPNWARPGSDLAPAPAASASAAHTLSGSDTRVNEYGASLGVSSWELDLWGKYRNKAASAAPTLLSTEAARDAVRLSVAGNTAKTYFQLRSAALQEQTAEPGCCTPVRRRTVSTSTAISRGSSTSFPCCATRRKWRPRAIPCIPPASPEIRRPAPWPCWWGVRPPTSWKAI